MSPPIIKPNTCSTCPFKVMVTAGNAKQLNCRRYPPVNTPLYNPAFDPSRPGSVPILGYTASFPVIAEDWFCGEHPGLRTYTFAPVARNISEMPHEGQG